VQFPWRGVFWRAPSASDTHSTAIDNTAPKNARNAKTAFSTFQ